MIMSFFVKKKQSKEARKRMEHLMYLAKESPDKKYDLTSCELAEIPSVVFSLCKVLQKEVLLVHTNLLKNLKTGGNMSDLANLRILDLHSNRLTKLPDEICHLKNLQVLNIENNCIAELPSQLGLVSLQTLNARDNKLQGLPNSVKDLKSLRTLDISGTNKVVYLPKTLCHVQTLEVLVLSNASQMEYPPAHVAERGLEEMMKFICKDVGVKYVPPAHNLLPVLDSNKTSTSTTDGTKPQQEEEQVNNIVLEYEKIKEDKRKKQLEIERHLYETQQEQALLACQSLHNRAKDLKIIADEQQKFDKSVLKQQHQQEKERKRMIALLVEAEKNASSLVESLLEMSEKARRHEALLEEMERKRMEEEEYFKVTQEDLDNLRKKETLAAMRSILMENDHFAILTQKYLAEQSHAARKAQGLLQSEEKNLEVAFSKQREVQNRLILELQNEEELQRQAFTALQFEQDVARQRIVKQIQQVEQALADLTAVELKKSKFKMDSEQEVLQSKRWELSDLLVVLLKEKDVREGMLKERLVEMEEQKENDQLDFWLVQYQRLLDSKPERLVERETMIDVSLIKLLTKAGAEHHLPSFARHKVVSISDLIPLGTEDLRRIGVFEIALQNNILRLVEEERASSKKLDSYEPSPSVSDVTPVITPVVIPAVPEPNAPELSPENECVVCMENQTSTVFLPCGHVCTCAECSEKLNKCPMCRSDIQQKIQLYRS